MVQQCELFCMDGCQSVVVCVVKFVPLRVSENGLHVQIEIVFVLETWSLHVRFVLDAAPVVVSSSHNKVVVFIVFSSFVTDNPGITVHIMEKQRVVPPFRLTIELFAKHEDMRAVEHGKE
jgi:hypothetical protein